VILPDSASSPRWEANDRPLLKAAFDSASIQSDIQNAGGDKAKFGTLCDSMINEGVNVLLIVNLDSDSGSACLKKAQAAGIKTIDYDRLTLGGSADVYVSFDNVKVGEAQASYAAARLPSGHKARVVRIYGAPTDNNATLFKKGAHAVLDGKVKVAQEYDTPDWSPDKAQTEMMKDYLGNVSSFNIHTFNSGEECLKNLNLNPQIIFLDYNFCSINRNIYHWKIFDGSCNCFNKNRSERKRFTFAFFKFIFYLVSPHHHVGHIGFHKGSDMRRGVLAHHHMIGDEFSHAIHFDDFYISTYRN
jgi:hypothetical protein